MKKIWSSFILSSPAPHGHVIQLDFRETFHLEESPTCEYDWLEIRNGPHGYSPSSRSSAATSSRPCSPPRTSSCGSSSTRTTA
ncbi:hypothetical protein CEXT_93021 [Caerostris extrusa]|uniref:CUB domain-containing protein n=1 Tax=Caerostris extrusa TaxID=172846 RepID=A0AAV4MWL9_CAEEX|nr:hypothetical protein CEXT_93021 [Caerostris extrusa]